MIEWKDIPNYEGLYQASNTGLIRSLDHEDIKMYRGKPRISRRKGKILSPGYLRGYNHVSLCKKGLIKVFKVHRLIMLTFKPIENDKDYQVNHINSIKDDNRLENLEWCTDSENQLHRYSRKSSNTSSKYRYISYRKDSDTWRLRGLKNVNIGHFKTEEEAYSKYLELVESDSEHFKNTKNDKSITSNDLF